MADVRQMVREEYDRFLEALPSLIPTSAGKWVVFLNGRVEGTFDTEGQALGEAVARFGPRGGFVVAPVIPVEAIPMTAGVLYSAPTP